MKTKSLHFKLFGRIIFFHILFLSCHSCYSQTTALTAYGIFIDSARAIDQMAGEIMISGIDSTTTTAIEIKIGNMEDDYSSLNQVIDFDPSGTLPSGFSYSRIKDQIVIGVSSAQPAWTYFCEIRVQNNSTWSNPIKFLCN